jgi:MiaB-like tRNA modifying enzyme
MIVAIETYGCSANQNNSEIMAGLLERAGFAVINAKDKSPPSADVVVLNTCIVKGPTLKRMERRLMDLLQSGKKVIVTGCMKAYRERIEKIAKIAKVGRANGKANGKASVVLADVKEIIKAVMHVTRSKSLSSMPSFSFFSSSFSSCDIPSLARYKRKINKVISINQIATGCVSHCSFCATKLAKGYLKSFEVEAILKNIKQDVAEGCKEIWLTATDVSCYGLDKGKYGLVDLLNKVCDIKGRFFVRVGMLNPCHAINYIDDLLEAYQNEKIFKFLHLPLQSASNKVLKEMRRDYSKEDFIEIAKKFRKKFADGVLATDMIVGFYNETEEDFEETIKLIKEIRPDVINISRFWPMPKTLAYAKWQKLEKSEREKIAEIAKVRSKILHELHEQISLEKNRAFVNKEVKVLVDKKEKCYEARDENYRLILLDSAKLGDFCKVKIHAASQNCLIGRII